MERDRLERIAEEHSYERLPGEDKGDGKEVRAAEPGAWREHLTDDEQRAMHEIMGAKLAELGYLGRLAAQAAGPDDRRPLVAGGPASSGARRPT